MANAKRERTDRRARVEQMRRDQQAKERRRTLISAVGVVLVVGALIVFVVIGTGAKHQAPTGPQIVPAAVVGGSTTVQRPMALIPNTTGISGVLAYDTKGYPAPGAPDAGTISHDHVSGPVTYAVLPPVGGPHNSVWLNAGVYTAPVPSEHAVHDLEHGAVWITYRPNLPAPELAKLRRFVDRQSMISEGDNSNRYVVMSPNDPRLQLFLNMFRHSRTYSPESGSPVDGVPVQTGGQAATDGSEFANPSGSAG